MSLCANPWNGGEIRPERRPYAAVLPTSSVERPHVDDTMKENEGVLL